MIDLSVLTFGAFKYESKKALDQLLLELKSTGLNKIHIKGYDYFFDECLFEWVEVDNPALKKLDPESFMYQWKIVDPRRRLKADLKDLEHAVRANRKNREEGEF
jgi:hypothetical protein